MTIAVLKYINGAFIIRLDTPFRRLDKMMLAVIVVLSLTATSSLGSIIGQCQNVKPVADFDLEKFAGTWYEIESYPSVDKVARRCSQFVVEFKDQSKAGLLHKFVSVVTEKQKTEYSQITSSTKEPGKLEVTPLKGSISSRKWPLVIIDTDYETYAVGYSCQKKLIAKIEDAIILSRTRDLDDKTKMANYETLKANNINQKSLMEVDQKHKDCKE